MSKIDQFIADAKLVRDKIRADIDKLRAVIEGAKVRLASAEKTLQNLETLRDNSSPEMLEAVLSKRTTPREDNPEFFARLDVELSARPLDPSDVVENARKILLEHGRPMKRGHLVREFHSRNLLLAGTDKNKNLGTILWRHPKQFVSIERLGYWVKDVPLPGVYEPSDD